MQHVRENNWHRPGGDVGTTAVETVDDSTCPLCWTGGEDDPIDISFALTCDHTYCLDCIQGMLPSAPMPYKCSADGCGKHVAWSDIVNLTAKGEDAEAALESVVKKAVTHAINGQMARVCPGLDCNQIRPPSSKDGKFSCDQVWCFSLSCGTSIVLRTLVLTVCVQIVECYIDGVCLSVT